MCLPWPGAWPLLPVLTPSIRRALIRREKSSAVQLEGFLWNDFKFLFSCDTLVALHLEMNLFLARPCLHPACFRVICVRSVYSDTISRTSPLHIWVFEVSAQPQIQLAAHPLSGKNLQFDPLQHSLRERERERVAGKGRRLLLPHCDFYCSRWFQSLMTDMLIRIPLQIYRPG